MIKNKIVNKLKRIDIIHLIIVYSFIYLLHLITRFHFVLWDEAVYLGMGKYIFSLGKVGLWEPLRPIALPFLLGIPWKLKINQIIAARIIELAFAAGVIILTYFISEKIFKNKKIALLNAFIVTITPIFFYNSMRIMSDIPALFFALFAVYFFISNKYFLSGMLSSIAFLFRFPTGLILVSIMLSLFIGFFIEFLLRKTGYDETGCATGFNKTYFNKTGFNKTGFNALLNNELKVLFGFLPLQLLFLIFNKIMYNNFFYAFIKASEHQFNPVHHAAGLMNLFYYPAKLFFDSPALILFAVIALLVIFKKLLVFKNKLPNKCSSNPYGNNTALMKNNLIGNTNLIVILVSASLYLVYFTGIANKQLRFAIAILPFIAMLSGYGIYKSLQYASQYAASIKKPFYYLLVSLFILLLVVSILFSLSFSMYLDCCRFKSFPAEKPQIVDEYYKYFPDDYNGNIVTSDPVPAAYADIKMHPYYYSVEDGLEEYDKYIGQANAIFFNKAPFMCQNAECENMFRPALFNKVQSNKLVFEKEYEDEKRWIYLVKS